MKYALVIPDGCGDEPQESLGGRTPLEAARLPNMDRIAAAGVVGRSANVPPHLPAGSEVANMSLFGYDPDVYFTGRAPLEAAAQDIELGEHDWAIRCNLVTIQDQVMQSFTAEQISTEEAEQLMQAAQAEIAPPGFEFHAGVSYRNLVVYRGQPGTSLFSRDTRARPPHDLTDKSVADDYPRGPGSEVLTDLMAASCVLFRDHPVNQRRLAAGKLPATNIWLWGLGQRPDFKPFRDLYGPQGAMITAVDLLRGLAALLGWKRIDVPGATGYLDTDYAGKGQYAVEALDEVDLIVVHVEAPDEASHEGRVDAKIEALEAIDREIVGPLHERLAQEPAWRMLISPDHPTPCRTKTHSHEMVPFAAAGAGIAPDAATTYDEPAAQASSLAFPAGWKLMGWFTGSDQSP